VPFSNLSRLSLFIKLYAKKYKLLIQALSIFKCI
jgi:hypothetical protein